MAGTRRLTCSNVEALAIQGMVTGVPVRSSKVSLWMWLLLLTRLINNYGVGVCAEDFLH
jgi:hypothetical protein